MARLKIGIASFAHPHAVSYAACVKGLENAELCGVTDSNKPRGEEMARKFGTDFYGTVDELIKKTKPDAVIVTSENSKHYSDALACIDAGVNVLCEKPMTTKLKDAKNLVKIVDKAGIVFQMCYVMRYHRISITVKELIDSGLIGEVKTMIGTNKLNINNILIADWFVMKELSGGGAIMDHTVHLADLMRWYSGKEARRIYTYVGKNLFKEVPVEDHFLTVVEFEDDVIGSIDGSWCMPKGYPTWGEVGMAIYGSRGAIIMDAFSQNIEVILDIDNPRTMLKRYYGCNADLGMIKEFVNCVREGVKKPRADVVDGLKGVEITLASYESARTGKAVELPLKV